MKGNIILSLGVLAIYSFLNGLIAWFCGIDSINTIGIILTFSGIVLFIITFLLFLHWDREKQK